MKFEMKQLSIAMIFILVFSAFAYASSGTMTQLDQTEAETEVKTFITNDLTIKVPTSQVPFYYFWETGDNTSTYRVQFDAVYEAVDNNSNSQYDPGNDTVLGDSMLALASFSWDMSGVVEDDEGTHFNLTGMMSYGPMSSDLVIQFNNHIMTTDDGTELKFDVIVNNYEWTSASEDTLLVLAYKIQSTEAQYNNQPYTDADDTARFGNGYFDSVPTASNSTGEEVSSQVTATVTTGQGSTYNESSSDNNGRIYLSYTYFEGNLTHDPTIGIDQDGGDNLFVADELSIKTPTSQVPFYFFWETGENETYRVQFDAMFEVYDENGDGTYNQDSEEIVNESMTALAQLGWEMSDISNTTNDEGTTTAYHFNLTGSTDSVMANPTLGDLRIQFRNHIYVDGDDSRLKFDVVIQNYDWTNSSEDTMLVLAYKLQSNSSSYDGSPDQNGNSVQFGNGYFNSSSTASNSTGEAVSEAVTANVSTGDGSGTNSSDDDARIYVSYSHFEGNMTHDPVLGLSGTDDGDDNTSGDSTSDPEETAASTLPFLMIVSGITLAVIPLLSRRFR